MRRSRFHDQAGNRVPWRNLPHLVPSLLTTIRAKRGLPGTLPWLGFSGIARLESLLSKTSSVLEFGSGSSTEWLARRCGRLLSIETSESWYARVREVVRDLDHVELQLLSAEDQLPSLAETKERFDLVLVDGMWRDTAMEVALRLVRRPGWRHREQQKQRDPAAQGHGESIAPKWV